jgi:acetyl esterase
VALAPLPVAAQPAVEIRRDIEYGSANGKRLLLDAYLPAGAGAEGRRPAVVMIHGGGWRVGDKGSWRPEAERLAGRGWVAFSINYRLDEPAVFPAEIDDARAAVRWARSHAGEYGVDPARIGAIGESAGGHLTAMLATLGSGALDDGARIRVGAAWSPPTDLTALAGSRGAGWIGPLLGCNQQTCPDRLAQASPVTHVDRSDAPLYLIHSTEELVPLSQAEAMAAKLQAAGVDHRLDVLPGNRHALDFRDDAWNPTLAFLETHLERPEPEADSGSPAVWLVGIGAGVAVATVVMVLRRRSSHAGPERPHERVAES